MMKESRIKNNILGILYIIFFLFIGSLLYFFAIHKKQQNNLSLSSIKQGESINTATLAPKQKITIPPSSIKTEDDAILYLKLLSTQKLLPEYHLSNNIKYYSYDNEDGTIRIGISDPNCAEGTDECLTRTIAIFAFQKSDMNKIYKYDVINGVLIPLDDYIQKEYPFTSKWVL